MVFFASFLIVITLLAVAGDWMVPYAPDAQDIVRKLELPSADHWFGTDALGRDLLARVIQGSQLSLLIGLASTVFAMLIGTVTGALAGFFGGWVDRLLTSTTDFFSIFPSLLLAILLSLLLGRGAAGILLSIGIVAWVQHARLVRAQVIQARNFTYVESARS
ncbi:ABC transporter permease, partial [bacterium]|nr:ABC transporter permease [bacterium]